ncbi:cellulase (glycosyl hydrolase family 5) [Paenibacillus methanolicus]|uniref:Cellulase (Glycosyl hydrolase family 5) n=2 Tax=Paenibacillus methanolicus TaxID=582686 RepID=A0A5S5CBH5_9BACL|nr:cellulase (glycosyl hydrolase family 5) [Paenibacillus methanolicus]
MVASIRKGWTSFVILTMMLSVIGVGGFLGQTPTAQADEGWNSIDTTQPITVSGSALDLSGMNDAPAGKYGFIQQGADGDYTFELAPNKKVKLYGANVTWNMYYGSQEDADKTVDRLARLGYNVVRIHPADAMVSWSQGIFVQNGSTTPQLNPDKLDRLEYFIAKLKSKGIYVAIDLFHLYDFKNIPGLGQYAEGYNSPYLLPIIPAALDMWKAIADTWLSHVNPYTGLPLKNDPVLIGVSPWNEALLPNMSFKDTVMKQDLRDYMLQDFNQYLASQGKPPITSFPPSTSITSYWDAWGDFKDQLSAYYSDKTITVSNAMRAYLKNQLGIKAPIGGLNYLNSPNVNYWRDQASDVFEMHSYYQFSNKRFTDPDGKGGYQYHPLREPRLSMAFNSATAANYPKEWAMDSHFISYYPALSLRQPYAKPFLLTEFQDTQPVKGREDLGIFIGATGAYHGWDMMNRFSFGRDIGDAYNIRRLGAPEEFSIANDPLAIMSETEAALLFRNGAVQAASPKFVFVWDRTGARSKGAASEPNAYISNMMYIPHLFKTVSVYADKPNEPLSVYKITPDVTPQQIASGNLPAANKLTISSSLTNRQMAELFINSLDDVNKKTQLLAALNENKLLSDTGELTFDLNLDTYFVNTPKAIAAAGTMNNHTFALGQATVTGDVYKGTFFASSLDGKELKDSERMVLIYKTDVAATGEAYVNLANGETKYYKGDLPTLVKKQTAQFALTTTKPASGFKAYKLGLNGTRLEEIPVTVNGPVLSVTLDTDKGFAFELDYGTTILMDNSDATTVGTWTSSTLSSQKFGADYLHDGNTAKGSSSITYTPNMLSAGSYDVYLWWNEGVTRANNVPVTVNHAGGPTTEYVNQQVDGGKWNKIGNFQFNAGTSGSVVISNTGTGGFVIADAVKFVKRTIIMDNTDSTGVTITGAWTPSSFSSQRIGADYLHDDNTAKGSSSVTYTPYIGAAGTYKVFLYWSDGTTRATNVPVKVNHAGGQASITVNQQLNGGQWNFLGSYQFNPGTTGNVVISNTGTNGFVIADAVKFEPQ